MSKRLAVFCGSSTGHDDQYALACRELIHVFLEHEIGMVFGGGSIGLMGVLADEMLAHGGEVIGVIPQRIFDWEVGHTGVTKLHVVETMHERKAMMADLSDGFVALPGGIGTLDELIEIYTWKQLGYHDKPVGILNINGYFDALLQMLDVMVQRGFLMENTREQLIVKETPKALVHQITHHI